MEMTSTEREKKLSDKIRIQKITDFEHMNVIKGTFNVNKYEVLDLVQNTNFSNTD